MSSRRSEQTRSVRALISARRFDDAVRIALQNLASTPDDPELLCLLAQAHLGSNRLGEALLSADRAAHAAPNAEWPHRLRSVALRRSGRKRESVAAAQEAVRIAPAMALARLTLSDAYIASKLGDQAYAEAEEGLRLAPDAAYAHDTVGRCLLLLKRFGDAERSFRRALELEPDVAIWHNNLGAALQGQGRIVEAIHEFDAAARLDPSPDLYRKNVYRGTRRMFLVGVVVVVGGFAAIVWMITLLLTRSPLAASATAIAVGLALALSVVRRGPDRRMKLPSTALDYYESEHRRRNRFWDRG